MCDRYFSVRHDIDELKETVKRLEVDSCFSGPYKRNEAIMISLIKIVLAIVDETQIQEPQLIELSGAVLNDVLGQHC